MKEKEEEKKSLQMLYDFHTSTQWNGERDKSRIVHVYQTGLLAAIINPVRLQKSEFVLGGKLTLTQSSLIECCFTSTETVGLLGTGTQDGHLDFRTAPELWHKVFCTWTYI